MVFFPLAFMPIFALDSFWSYLSFFPLHALDLYPVPFPPLVNFRFLFLKR